ncbi:MAG: GNAT family N-acetyltransferase [Streptosporangiaceae bacterium]
MSETPQVVDNAQASRFELTVDGHLAELVYRRRAGRLVLIHTGVPDEMKGTGIGGQLVRAAVGQAAAEGLTVVPLCSFAGAWLRGNPDVAATVAIDWGDQPATQAD